MVVHILIVYADFSRCRARFSWWDFVTTACPRKFEISYRYTCSSPFWHCYKMDRKKHLFWLKRSKGLDKTPIFDLFYQNWPSFFSFCNITKGKRQIKMFIKRENISRKLTSMVKNKVSIKFSFVMFFWVSAFLWTPR